MNSKVKKCKIKIIVLLAIPFMILLNQSSIVLGNQSTYTNITVHTAYSMINDTIQYPELIILDVRTQGEYNQEHLYNATLIPVDQLSIRIGELEPYKNIEIIVYCRTGFRSQQASAILLANNFTKIFNMLGGITEWIEAGYEYWSNENLNQVIDFSLIFFLGSTISITIILIIFYKKRKLS